MRTNFVRGIVSTAITLTFAVTSAWAADMSVDSQVGELLDNPDSKAVLEKHIPDFISNPQIEQARGMSLRSLQTFAPTLTDDVLAEIDKDLAETSHAH
tara:strand:- start:389 stop:682 length:294 start_codon:yes stop_codon:yes gene_type:complete